MPERINSFAPMILGVLSVLVAMIAVQSHAPVRADSACIEKPNQPAAEGTRWSARFDRAKGRKCWFLVDVTTNEAAPPQAQESTVSSLASQITSWLGSLTGASAAQVDAAQGNPASGPRKPQANVANAGRTDVADRTDQKGVGDGRAVKRVSSGLTQPQREALFEEFLRWHQSQENVSEANPPPASR